jgi:hypothetical protein
MSAHLTANRQSLGRTFTVAAVVLGLIGAAQVGAVGWKLFQRPPEPVAEEGPRRPPEKIDINRLVADMPPPEEPGPLTVVNDPLQGDPVTVGPTGPRPVPLATPLEPKPVAEAKPEFPASALPRPLVQARPTPVPLSALTPKVSPQFTELIEQGKLLRNTGDTAGALVKFREASALEPSNAQAIAEQAYTYEKMSLHDKAAEQWKRVLSFGESGGVLYSAAKSKLDMAMSETMRVASPAGPTRAIAEGKVVGLGTPVAREEPDPASAKKFVLHVPINSRSGHKMSVKDMKVFVLFYDRLNGSDLASTAANVSNRWGDPPADWADGNVETLEVTYDLPPTEGRGERREFYGYIVRLYYQDQLQDSFAEPAALNQRFPAAHTLSD